MPAQRLLCCYTNDLASGKAPGTGALLDASAGAQQTAALHWRFSDTVWLVIPVHCSRTNGVDRWGHLDYRGVHSSACAAASQFPLLPSRVLCDLQVDLPVNSRIEYKYVILEEQVCTCCARAPALVFSVIAALAVGLSSFRCSVPRKCIWRPAGLDEAGERGC